MAALPSLACLKINQDVSSSSLESLSQNPLRSSFILHLISDQPPPVAHLKDPGPGLLVLFPSDSHRLFPFTNTDILPISKSHPLCCPNCLNLPMTTPRLLSPGPVTVLPCKLWTIALQPTSPLVRSDFGQFYFKFNFFHTHIYRGV